MRHWFLLILTLITLKSTQYLFKKHMHLPFFLTHSKAFFFLNRIDQNAKLIWWNWNLIKNLLLKNPSLKFWWIVWEFALKQKKSQALFLKTFWKMNLIFKLIFSQYFFYYFFLLTQLSFVTFFMTFSCWPL